MDAPDLASLSVADRILGRLKDMARVDNPLERNYSQGVAARAVTELSKEVDRAARQAGPNVVKALEEGRKQTVAKHDFLDVLEAMGGAPEDVYKRLVQPNDSNITLLRDVARTAPQGLPMIGRAWLEDLFNKAKAEGGFNRADKLWRDWDNLGPSTKQLLFKDPALVKDLDNFFLLQKRIAANPNPSGSALTAVQLGEAGLWMNDPARGVRASLTGAALAKLLYSPKWVRVLTRGTRIPITQRGAAAATVAELIRLAREQGVEVQSAGADDQPAAP